MTTRRTYAVGAAGLAVTAVAGLLAGGTAAADASFAAGGRPAANPRDGVQDNRLATDLDESPVAWGQLPLTNPDTALGNTHYGYNTSASTILTQDPHEAFKTEPDKNAYLVFGGHHYLYQGHEGGPAGYVTRIDLDQADPAKRVSLVGDTDSAGAKLPNFDGITWDPFSHQLLLTAESKAPTGGVFAVSLDAAGEPTSAVNRLTALGSGGYEGVQNDADGNVWIVEDVGGAAAGTAGKGKVPNSYVYRFRPADRTDLGKGGTLEALQVLRSDGTPVTAAQLQADGRDPFIGQLHTYGAAFATRWATLATPVTDSTAAANAAGATPFKRPENGVFRPGAGFREFYFTETGDTNAASDLPGAFGAVFKLVQPGPSATRGRIEPVTLGDVKHTGFDNISFASRDEVLVVEDAGDGLHAQRDALDSGYVVRRRRQPRGAFSAALARRGPRRLGHLRRTVLAGVQRRRQRDHGDPRL